MWDYDTQVYAATPLAVPGNLRITGTVAEWDAVTDAGDYDIDIFKNGASLGIGISTDETSYDLLYEMQLYGNGTYTFQVRADPASDDISHTESPYSAMSTDSYVYNPTPLAVPGNLRFTGTVAEWDAVTDAERYKIEIFKDGIPIYSYPLSLEGTSSDLLSDMQSNGNGTYTFKVSASPASDDISHMESPYSAMSTDS